MKKRHLYHAFLLRCWQESDVNSKTSSWRFSLEGAQDGRRIGFADVQTVADFLRQITQPRTGSEMSRVCSERIVGSDSAKGDEKCQGK